MVISHAIANNQQLSKKMGSHVSGERYKGSYKNGLKHGHGTWTHPDGDKYRGKFKSGLKRGNGVYTFKNGEEYRGHFKRDQQHGLGQYKYNNGEVFKGEFKNNIRDGQGFIVFRGDFGGVRNIHGVINFICSCSVAGSCFIVFRAEFGGVINIHGIIICSYSAAGLYFIFCVGNVAEKLKSTFEITKLLPIVDTKYSVMWRLNPLRKACKESVALLFFSVSI